MILETYETERRPIAENLMEMDRRLNKVCEDKEEGFSEMKKVRDHYSGAISGLQITYKPSLLVREDRGDSNPASFVKIGARLPPSVVVPQGSDSRMPFEKLLHSDGSWKLLVFLGSKQSQTAESQSNLLHVLQGKTHLSHVAMAPRKRFPRIETVLIRPGHESNKSNCGDCLDGHPPIHAATSSGPDTRGGMSARAVFHATESYQPYRDYGIDGKTGCIILCRPDQHVAWIGNMGELSSLDNFFSLWIEARR